MPSHKFTYFPVRGLDEFIRLMFHYTKVPFKDNRIAFNDWPNLKPSKRFITISRIPETPFGKLSVLEVDGKPLVESFAIARFLARQNGSVFSIL